MGKKVKITVRVSRYQKEKLLGEKYRREGDSGVTFSNWKKKNRKKQ